MQLRPLDNEQGAMDATLVDAFDLYVEQLVPSRLGRRKVRGSLEELRAAGDRLIALRDNLGLTNEKFVVHVCRHDEGVGACTSVMV